MDNNQKFVEQGNTKEVRFAVVMYGGVSLAIYINGVAQELLKMCRATVAGIEAEKLVGTEKIYRRVSALMADEKMLDQMLQMLEKTENSGSSPSEIAEKQAIEKDIEKRLDELVSSDKTPLTKFVVDVLTGTSAGGINAIFLAKALANNQKIAQLRDMWLNEGDVKVLINDKLSVDKTGLSVPDQPKSLLNSQRMYLKLLEAFEGMGKDKDEDSIYTNEIDLFVPTTDFKGVVIPLRLLDQVVEEKRFAQVFRFRYEKGRENDFKNNNPMLAFAARATSSFPFAFEPMRLSQAYKVIEEGFEDWKEKKENLIKKSKKYFPKIIKKNCEPIDWTERDLVDGGVLDNKPFGYAIDVLSERRADFLCERKLLYIEPSPENYSVTRKKNENDAPSAIDNAVASLSSIPGYETIREDLERLLERNKLIERVTELISKSEKDVFEYLMKNPYNKDYLRETGDYWEKQGLEDIVKWKGRAVLPYYRLRIADLTDDIARLVSRIIGIEEETENYLTIRIFVKAWRDDNFGFYKKTAEGEPEKTVLAFLRSFDLRYRLRRLRFVQEKATLLYRFDHKFREDLTSRKTDFVKIETEAEKNDLEKNGEMLNRTNGTGEDFSSTTTKKHPYIEQSQTVSNEFLKKFDDLLLDRKKPEHKTEKKPSEIIWLVSNLVDGEREIGIEKIRLTANYFMYSLQGIFKEMQSKRDSLFSKQGQLSNNLSNIEITPSNLQVVFDYFDSKKKTYSSDVLSDKVFIAELKNDFKEVFDNIRLTTEELEKELNFGLKTTREQIKSLFDAKNDILPDELRQKEIEPELFNAVKGFLNHYYENFDECDQLSFPIFYETKVGEAVKVDVMRISPQDATSIINEREQKRQKLAGESLFHFGAFLDRVWRFNDILWGRLDGVERLITALLPDEKYEKVRNYLTKKAHLEILKEDLLTTNKAEVQKQLLKNLLEKSAGIESKSEAAIVSGEFMDDKIQQRIDKVLQNCLEPESAYQFLKNDHNAQNRLEPKDLLRVISRSTKVTGDIFEGIADKDSRVGSQMRWISRIGTIFWGLVEVAAPNSFWNLLFNHWLMLIYFVEVVLLFGSTIFVKPEIQQFATVSLILTLIIHLTAVTLGDFMRGGKFWSLIRFVAVGIFAILTIAGGIFIYSFFYDANLWNTLNFRQNEFNNRQYYLKLFPVALLLTIFAAMLTWRETGNTRVKFFGGVSVVFAVAAVIFGFIFKYISADANGINNLGAVLSLEFAGKIAEIKYITKEFNPAAVRGLKWALAIDSFLFVPLYTGFLLIFSRLFKLRKWEWKDYFMKAAAILIIITALADLSENVFSYAVLATPKDSLTDGELSGIWISSSIKWLALAAATGILSLIFWRKGWWTFFSVGLMCAAVCGIVGIVLHTFIQNFMFLQIFLLLVIGLLFWFFPDKFKREF